MLFFLKVDSFNVYVIGVGIGRVSWVLLFIFFVKLDKIIIIILFFFWVCIDF